MTSLSLSESSARLVSRFNSKLILNQATSQTVIILSLPSLQQREQPEAIYLTSESGDIILITVRAMTGGVITPKRPLSYEYGYV